MGITGESIYRSALAIGAISLLTGCGPLSCARACKPPLEPGDVIILAHEYGVTAIHGGSLEQELLCSSPMGAGSSALPVVRPGRDGQVLVLGDGGVTTCDGGIRLSRERHAAPRTWRVESPDGSGVIVVDECTLVKPWTGRNCRGRLEKPDGETVDLARTVNMDANAPLWLDREAIVYRDSTGTNVIEDFARGTVREIGEPGWVVVSAEIGGSELIAHDGRSVYLINRAIGNHREIYESPSGVSHWVIVSPDRRFVVFSYMTLRPERQDVYMADLANGSTCRLARNWHLLGGYWSRGHDAGTATRIRGMLDSVP